MKYFTKRDSKKILAKLEQRFIDGERISVLNVIADKNYFNSETHGLSYLYIERLVRGWIQTLKRRMRLKYNLWLGNIDYRGNYGIVLTKEEAMFAMTRYYRLTKGIIRNAYNLNKEVKEKNLLPFHEENLLLAKPEGIE